VSSQPLYCSVRFVRPFLDVVTRYLGSDPEIAGLRGYSAESQITVGRVYELIEQWVRATGRQDLGLRAGEIACVGSSGVLDYALHSAATLRDSISVAQRYSRLYSDALELAVTPDGARVSIRFATRGPAPRAFLDFVLSAWYRWHLSPHFDPGTQVECFFSSPEPVSVEAYRALFKGARLRFGAAFDGFSCEARALDRPLASADPSLHEIHCERLALLDASSAPAHTVAMRVQRILVSDLGPVRLTSSMVARRLRMSRRTLARQLACEGTTYKLLLDQMRHQRALNLLHTRHLQLTEVARLLGFAQVQAFHRAFKRWTGSSPCQYRDASERDSSADEGGEPEARL
jgi:AraC-like DNA-binding protein